MKTIEWFEQMAEPYRSLAIEAFNSPAAPSESREADYDYITDALWFGFFWDMTPQKFDYWNAYYKTLLKLGL